MKEIKPAIILTLVFIIFSGFLFPGVTWVASQTLFPNQANGSFVKNSSGQVVGSALIGQAFSSAKYFHGRPSAAGTGYDGASSSGTNLGPISAKLIQGIKDDPTTPDSDETYFGVSDLATSYRLENGLTSNVVLPADAVTRSGSGLDPEISPGNAILQANRVSSARGIAKDKIIQLIEASTEERFLGIWGERRVNVLKLNLLLDKI
jgi:K+-transporting ATPase ATPase C chain